MDAYCSKCRTGREMKEPKAVTMKNGRPGTRGVCPVCGCRLFRVGPASPFPLGKGRLT